MDAQIKYDFSVTRCNGIGVDFNGLHYEIIYGHYINGGFFSIVNFGVAGDMNSPTDVFYNTERIGQSLHDFEAGKAIAEAIKEYEER